MWLNVDPKIISYCIMCKLVNVGFKRHSTPYIIFPLTRKNQKEMFGLFMDGCSLVAEYYSYNHIIICNK